MKIKAPFVIGGRTYEIEIEAESMLDFVRQIGPWHDLEKHSKPGCVFQFRRSKDGKYEFCSLYSPSDDTELPLGERLNPKGQLFAGKIHEEGSGKNKKRSLVIKWQRYGGGPQIDDEESFNESSGQQQGGDDPGDGYPESWAREEKRGNNGNLKAVPPLPSTHQSAAEKPATRTPEDDAADFVSAGLVAVIERNDARQPSRWSVGVGVEGRLNHVWYDAEARPQCDCPALLKNRKAEPGYRCAHILAVKLFHEQLKRQAAKSAA